MSQFREDLHVSIDVGCYEHSVAVGLSNGQFLGEFEISHNKQGFKHFFNMIDNYKKQSNGEVFVAMEGYNGHARPLDALILQREHHHLMNINNLKLARFKEIFPGPAKTDKIDARKGLELFQLQKVLPLAKTVLEEVYAAPIANKTLKQLTRRRKRLVEESVRCSNALHADLRAVSPGLVDITRSINNRWFLNFLSSAKDIRQLAKKRYSSLLKIEQVGEKYADIIRQWQNNAMFSDDADLFSCFLQEDIARLQAIKVSIKEIEDQIMTLLLESDIAQRLSSMEGFGFICCAELAGEIGTIQSFKKEGSLALYLGMVALDNSSGTRKATKASKQVNKRAKTALMTAVNVHRQYNEQSAAYYAKKRKEGKKHNQALRSLGRHLCRVIYKMLTENRDYYIEDNFKNRPSADSLSS